MKDTWSSSEVAEHWQQDVERRRLDFAEATQRMLEAAGLKPGNHVLDPTFRSLIDGISGIC